MNNAYTHAEATETRTYLEAYEKCTVPKQSDFRDHAELDGVITRQLAVANFHLTVAPNIQAKLDKLVARIRNTWVRKYGLTFGGAGVRDATAPPEVFQPLSLTWNADDYVSPGVLKRGADGEALDVFAAGFQCSNTAPGMPINNGPLVVPPRSDFTFRAPRGPRALRQSSMGGPARFAGNNVAPQPLFADGEEPQLTYFAETYKSLDDIRTHDKREKTERLLDRLPGGSVARCMEALWRCDYDVDKSERWLRQTPADQGKHVIELLDSDNDDHEQSQRLDHVRAKKKQKLGQGQPKVLSKKAKKELNGKNGGMGTLQRPSEKALSYMLASPEYERPVDYNIAAQPFSQSGTSFEDSTLSNNASGYIPLNGGSMPPATVYNHVAPRPAQRSKLPVGEGSRASLVLSLTCGQSEVIDLTNGGGHPALTNSEGSGLLSDPVGVGASTTMGMLESSRVAFGSARTVTPDPAIWENIFQNRSTAGHSRRSPVPLDEITGTVMSLKETQKLQAIAAAAQNENAGNSEKVAQHQSREVLFSAPPSKQWPVFGSHTAQEQHESSGVQFTKNFQREPQRIVSKLPRKAVSTGNSESLTKTNKSPLVTEASDREFNGEARRAEQTPTNVNKLDSERAVKGDPELNASGKKPAEASGGASDSIPRSLAHDKEDEVIMSQASELEEGEIHEDEPTAFTPKHAVSNVVNGERASMNSLNGASSASVSLHGSRPASINFCVRGFGKSVFGKAEEWGKGR